MAVTELSQKPISDGLVIFAPRQLGDIHRDPTRFVAAMQVLPCFIFAEQLGRVAKEEGRPVKRPYSRSKRLKGFS
jgi:hypothetical protein